ncbi:hypothetical protein LTR62_006275 [Meristemomyces frigidus]|uniref:Amino acid transporter transmembrane domain-containing protein n=1 Tax=Meristemomyces frigidus TaxID=1508187 RepID=A0AAN7TGD5_9PEZI|nr:hypothetical protein LTR62_006275 [Meristemomyces frigidus]
MTDFDAVGHATSITYQLRNQSDPQMPVSNSNASPKADAGEKKTVTETIRRLSSVSGWFVPRPSRTDEEKAVGSDESAPNADSPRTLLGENVVAVTAPDEIDTHNLHWFKAALIMIAETISLGILSLPFALSTLGIVPGVILIWVFGFVATYTGFAVWQFKMTHWEMASLAHGLELVFGRWGRYVGHVSQTLMMLFVMSAHVVIFGVAMTELTDHGLCRVWSMAIGAFLCFVVSIPRTMKGNSYYSALSCLSITIATLIALIAIAKANPAATFSTSAKSHAFLPTHLVPFRKSALATSSIILAYNSHLAYPTIINEMSHPRDFPKALIFLETFAICFYTLVAVIIYVFAGQAVASPAIGSASPLVRKVSFGFALPTIIVAGVILALVLAKNLMNVIWRKDIRVATAKSTNAWVSWLAILLAIWVLAWVVANVIPNFGQIVGLIGALFGTWFALGICSVLWLGMNRGRYWVDWRKMALTGANGSIVLVSAALCVVGSYGSILDMVAGGDQQKPFSCG